MRTLGIHTVRVLLDCALWQAAQRYPNLAFLHHDDAGLSQPLYVSSLPSVVSDGLV